MRENYNDLHSFLTVAQEKSFSRAATKLRVSPPALSKTIRLLEERLGLQLFVRTTRQVSLTHAGEQLFRTAEQSFGKLNHELELLAHYRNAPSGLVRINAGLQVVEQILIPTLAHFRQQYPDIQLELISENHFVDIIAEGFDAGVRLGSDVGEGMIAVKISDPMKMVLVVRPDYLAQHGFPKTLSDLTQYQGLGYRLTNGQLYAWEFQQNGETIKITPPCQWIFNDDFAIKTAALQGLGIAYLPEMLVENEVANGSLITLFSEHCQSLPALYLYYPHRNVSPALRVVIDSLKVT
ncbi:LysR family transcriptional regulator [Bibersteinia trehalosi]|uniref:LysR family transcriptional regulator n=1 Tax=Bibersteinia trehalosi TaxID=47735 RepID=A0A426FL02_BIBTR|nr:LysR family transcriptional regulator [Bibersteinia trehalosi]RRN05877.1 LysR family transcriptional regulator [Bibersteinia trehalosi]